jgi:hypothetical protein
VHVRFGTPVDLSGLGASAGRQAEVGATAGRQAVLATTLIIEAIDRTLAVLRVDEPKQPKFVDVTRPVDMSRIRRRARVPDRSDST